MARSPPDPGKVCSHENRLRLSGYKLACGLIDTSRLGHALDGPGAERYSPFMKSEPVHSRRAFPIVLMLLAGSACSTVDTLSYAPYAEKHGIALTELAPPEGAIPLGTIFFQPGRLLPAREDPARARAHETRR